MIEDESDGLRKGSLRDPFELGCYRFAIATAAQMGGTVMVAGNVAIVANRFAVCYDLVSHSIDFHNPIGTLNQSLFEAPRFARAPYSHIIDRKWPVPNRVAVWCDFVAHSIFVWPICGPKSLRDFL